MKRLLFLVLFFGIPVWGFATDYFVGAATAGSGSCLTSAANNCLFATAAALVSAGDTIHMANGTYTGANSMINPPGGVNGSSGSPITVSATNDGGVLIDGQGARTAISLVDNDWWVVEGINAKNGAAGLDVVVEIGATAANNIIRRTIAWDAAVDANSCVYWVYSTDGPNLLEDVAGFGSGRKIFCNSQGGNNLTIRRAWGMWNKNTYIFPGINLSGPYYTFSNAYDSFNAIYENVIGTYDEEAGSVHTGGPADFGGILSQDHALAENAEANAKYLGSIAYTLSSQTIPAGWNGSLFGSQYLNGNVNQDVVMYSEQGDLLAKLDNMTNDAGFPASNTGQYTRGTEIGSGGATIGGEWTVTNRATGVNVAAVPNIWNGAGTNGARVCYRYVDGTLTATPLWPWPMNDRIIAALNLAGRAAIDVTATMEDIFGTIPEECGGADPGPPEPPPSPVLPIGVRARIRARL